MSQRWVRTGQTPQEAPRDQTASSFASFGNVSAVPLASNFCFLNFVSFFCCCGGSNQLLRAKSSPKRFYPSSRNLTCLDSVLCCSTKNWKPCFLSSVRKLKNRAVHREVFRKSPSISRNFKLKSAKTDNYQALREGSYGWQKQKVQLWQFAPSLALPHRSMQALPSTRPFATCLSKWPSFMSGQAAQEASLFTPSTSTFWCKKSSLHRHLILVRPRLEPVDCPQSPSKL